MLNCAFIKQNTVQANRLYGYFAVFLCPQAPFLVLDQDGQATIFAIKDSSPKPDLTCNERSECELRTATFTFHFSSISCSQFPSCFAIRESSPLLLKSIF